MDHLLLAHAVESWQRTTLKRSQDFDTCVLNLILAAMEESREDAINYPLYGAAITEAARSVSLWRIQESEPSSQEALG